MKHVGILIIVITFVGLATLYSLVIPLGEGPDEPGHAAYVFFLAREGRLPVQRADVGQSDVPGEGHQPPLAYVLAVPLVAWLPPQERRFDLPGNARFTWASGDELNAVAHGSREYPPWSGVVLAWHLGRLVSVLLGAVTVVCTYRAALALLGAQRHMAALLGAALVALNPQFIFIAALMNNDVLLAALGAALLWLVLGSRRRAAGFAIGVGAILGLALLTKQSALIFAPIALLAIVERAGLLRMQNAECRMQKPLLSGARRAVGLVRMQNEECRMQKPLRSGARRTLGLGLLALITTLAIAGWWYARNWRLYGDPLGLGVFRAEFMTQPFAAWRLAAWRDALAQLHDSFWARFGWMNVPPPAWVIWAVTLLELLALVGLLRGAVDALRAPRACWRRWSAGRWSLLVLPVLTFAWVVSFAFTAGLVAWQGRLLFPALPAIAILLACGLSRALPIGAGRRANGALGAGVCLALGAIALWIPFGVIRPAYPFHTLPEPAALAQIGTPVYGRFGLAGERGAELRGWRLEGTARAGRELELVLVWHALERQNRDWTAFIHLVDQRDQILAQDNRLPQDGAFPMTQWVGGDWVEDRHPLRLPANLAPGVYTLRVGLFDQPGTQERTGVYDESDTLVGDYLDIGSITVK